ncbi:MAG: fibronectin type III domain-containing protein, partial [Patescibacteria group bacterium]|nr:fibronectin type III domain-containing protein [Patescibacteria group bacterium]
GGGSGATGSGDKTGVNATPTMISDTTILTPATDLVTGAYLNNTARIRIAANDGNSGNSVGFADSGTFTVDTTVPAYTSYAVNIDSNTSPELSMNISATAGQTATQMRFSSNSSLTSETCASVAVANWETYATTKSWSDFAPGPNGSVMVYWQFKDAYCNVISGSTSTPEIPQNMLINDIATPPANSYQAILWWNIVSDPGNFKQYNVYRSTSENGIYELKGIITDRLQNYCIDEGVDADTDCVDGIGLGGLDPLVEYWYQVTAEDNNKGTSGYSTKVHVMPDGSVTGEGNAVDNVSPNISSVSESLITTTSVDINWTTDADVNNASYSVVKYSTDASYNLVAGDPTTFTTGAHTVSLSNLSEGTTYNYQILATDEAGNSAFPFPGSFTTLSTAPTITSGPTVIQGMTTATFYWQTSEASNTQINYIASADNTVDPATGTTTTLQSDMVTDHYVSLTGLTENTTYTYNVISSDSAATPNTLTYPSASPYLQFTTLTEKTDIIDPVITNNNVVATATTLTFTWDTTSDASYSIVEYGTTDLLGSTAGTLGLVESHSVEVTGLNPGTLYYYRLVSADSQANLAAYPSTTTSSSVSTSALTIPNPPSAAVSKDTIIFSWATNGPATSQVEYSLNGDLSSSSTTTLDSTKVTNHIVELSTSALDTGATYYYRVISQDGATVPNSVYSPSVSPYSSFVTLSTNAPTVDYNVTLAADIDSFSTADIALSSTSLLASSGTIQIADEKISYTSKDDGTNIISGISRAQFNTTGAAHTSATGDFIVSTSGNSASVYLSSLKDSWFSVIYEASSSLPSSYTNEYASPTLVTTPTPTMLTIPGLSVNTKYYYKLKARDVYGNETISTPHYFTTTSDISVPSTIVLDYTNSQTTATSAELTWISPGDDADIGTASSYDIRYSTTDMTLSDWASATQVLNEPTPIVAGTSQSMTVTGLSPGTTYYFGIKAADESSNESLISNIVQIDTPSQSDTTAPVITFTPATDIGTPTTTTVTITWSTDEDSSSLIDFGTVASATYGTTQGNYSELVKNHSVTLTGLVPSTDYQLKIRSIDSSGNIGINQDAVNNIFSTASALAGTNPNITDVTSTVLNGTSVRITWNTGVNSDSVVGYSVSPSKLYSMEEGNASQVTSHSITLTNLSPGTTYFYRVKSRNGDQPDIDDNATNGYTFTTTSGADSIPPVISDVTVTGADGVSATITWITNENANSIIDFGTVSSALTSSQGNSKESVTTHSVSLASLTASTTYYFQVRSVDSAGNESTDNNGYTFDTTSGEVVECPRCGGGSSVVLDTTAPTITNIVVSDITTTSATVSWNTSEYADSFVEYGETNGYGSIDGSHSESIQTHSIVILGLDSDKTYNYRVSSKDSSGNLAQSDNLTFKTLSKKDELTPEEKEKEKEQQENQAEEIQKRIEELVEQGMDEETIRSIIAKATQPPAIDAQGPDITDITNSSASVSWRTDRKSNSVVRFKVKEEGIDPESSLYLKQYGSFTTLDTDHKVIISGLLSGTTYQYQVQSSDILGNTGKSPWQEFTTKVIPNIYDVIVSDVTLNSVIINWKTNIVSSSKVEYGTTINYISSEEDKDKSKVAKHFIKLNNLQSGTTYHYRVRGIDDSGNAVVSDDYTFTTFTLPQIESYTIEKVEDTKTIIKWQTNVETDSTIKYTDIKTGIVKKQGEDALSTVHVFTLKSLDPGTEYSIQIQGRDIYANQVISPELKLTTLVDETPAEITQVRTETAISSGKSDIVQTIINWKTNEPTTSQILWEEGISKEDKPQNSSQEDTNFTTNHISIITSFKPASVYRFRIAGKDKSGNYSESQDFTILIPEKKKSVIQIIIGNFEDTFGWVKNMGL